MTVNIVTKDPILKTKQFLLFTSLLLLSTQLAVNSGGFRPEARASATLRVPEGFPTIQAAINNAEVGDTVLVSAGTYYERVVVNRTITLLGEGREKTVLDGENALVTIIKITADDVEVSGFQLRKTGWGWGRAGVEVYGADNCTVTDNLLYHTAHQIRIDKSQGTKVIGNTITAPSHPFPQSAYGIRVENSKDCLIEGNAVSNNIGGIHLQNATGCTIIGNHVSQNGQGIRLYSPCQDNRIIANTVFNNSYDGMIEAMPDNETLSGNVFLHNNFVNNSKPFIYKVEGCIWDNGQEGNYWTAYQGVDSDQNGVGDSPYPVGLEQDNNPLMGQYIEREVQKSNGVFTIGLVCNSSATKPTLNSEGELSNVVSFTLTTQSGNAWFARISIPRALLDAPFTLEINDSEEPNSTLRSLPESNETIYLLYFTDAGIGATTYTVTITGTETVSDNRLELPLHSVLIILGGAIAAIGVAAYVIRKRGRKR